MQLEDFDFDLPPERIAQSPLQDRAAARLLVVDRTGATPPEHRAFSDIVDLLPAGALLVLNETRVIPARLAGRRATGGKVEVLLVRPLTHGWEAIVNAGGRLRAGEEVALLDASGAEAGARLTIVEALGGGRHVVAFPAGSEALEVAERLGRMPLPPYIRRAPGDAREAEDRDLYQTVLYQTVFARVPGAIAAPTAGLHFTPELLAALEARGVEVARVVLHVGLGTFCPIRVERIEDHVMHAERYEVPEATRARIAAARARGAKVVACGTTSVRALEAWASSGRAEGETELFITPGFRFQVVDALITNFHLPKSTLLLLVSAFASREVVLSAYRQAVERGYRFFSYGDAMLLR
jgi:S-adenosylmethionine:tRNA ribosyltransferase-isomerase